MPFNRYIAKLTSALSYLIYPKFCLNCKESLWFEKSNLCSTCLRFVYLVDDSIHCPSCFFNEKPLCSPHLCNTLKAVTAIFYKSLVEDYLWEYLRVCEVFSAPFKPIKGFFLYKAIQLSDQPYNTICISGDQENETKLFELAKWLGKKLKVKNIIHLDKCQTKNQSILMISDYLKKKSEVQKASEKLKKEGNQIVAIALIADLDPDPSWNCLPVGSDPSLL